MGYNQINLNTQREHIQDFITYEVQPGDTIQHIADQHNIKVKTILWANDIASVDRINTGDTLIILPIDGILHEVLDDEDLAEISTYYGVGETEILKANAIPDRRIIFAGQKIIIPGSSFNKPPKNETSTSRALAITADEYFIRPAQGVLSQGLHQYNAIDISSNCWSPIYAAADGTVSIAADNGEWNRGYGKFITIKHPNNTTTLYAHLIKIAVVYGEYVKQGEIIGYMGSTGYSTGCHLHFEVHGARNTVR